MPAQWVNEGGTEVTVDALQVAAWFAGPAALAILSHAQSVPATSALGDKVRALAAARSPQNMTVGSASGGMGNVWLGQGAQRDEMGLSTDAVVVEGDVGWLICTREPSPTDGQTAANLAWNRPVRVSSESGEGQGWGAVDGSDTTRWLSGIGDSEWLEVDLGGVHRACAVRVEWGIATARSFEVQAAVPQRWESEYSQDGALLQGPDELDVSRFTLAIQPAGSRARTDDRDAGSGEEAKSPAVGWQDGRAPAVKWVDTGLAGERVGSGGALGVEGGRLTGGSVGSSKGKMSVMDEIVNSLLEGAQVAGMVMSMPGRLACIFVLVGKY